MGKTQSKRSVDITTEAKKTPDEEVGKLEKIEDLDQKQVNGDASSQDNAETETLQKKEGDETENDKDLTTEKSGGESGAQDGGGDSNTGQCNTSAAEPASKEDDSAASKDGNKTAEEISPLADENNKKPKKEKVKKKWSFRSISFGKKDKQKPTKAEDAATENAAATNDETAAQVGEGAATEEAGEKVQNTEAAGDPEAKKSCEKPIENGDSSEKEVNGEKTSTSTTPIEEQPAKEISSNENATNITKNTTETTNSVENNSTTTTETNQTEKKTTTTATIAAADTFESAPAVVSNGEAIENNGTDTLSTVDEQKDQVIDKAAELIVETSDVVEKMKSIPNVANEVSDNNGVHQNGTSANGEELETEIESKSQVEIENCAPSSTSVIRDLTETKFEEAIIATESAASVVVDVAFKAIEPVSTSTVSDTNPIVDGNVYAGNEEPPEPEPQNERRPDQSPTESHCETEGDESNTAVSATSTAHESPKPPPLPVSPPPSQVSVFAFNDNNQVEEEGICAPSTDILAEIETSKPPSTALCNDIVSMPDLQSTDEKILNKEDGTCDLPSSCVQSESDTETIVIEAITPEYFIKQVEDTIEQPEASEAPENSSKYIQQNILVTDEEPSTANFPNSAHEVARVPEHISENEDDEFVKAATAVVDEITEKAVELIQQQKDVHLQSEVEESDQIITTNDEDIKTDNKATGIDNHVNDDESFPVEEVKSQMESFSTKSEDTDSIKNAPLAVESLLHDCLKTTDKHIVEEENPFSTEICSDSVVSVNDNQN
ncbi:A-kinase anchor protein 200 isoform X3 [Anastrepha obliqua]|uniref:A-kinase anchor protein 200 isoform X3 n=1 Tax=Anastrepha obliqua TaxID=95512 RepID=UPI002409F253|nr:A-kinase anchor protein 200 isoform X3 [Anastrepha obliqua]